MSEAVTIGDTSDRWQSVFQRLVLFVTRFSHKSTCGIFTLVVSGFFLIFFVCQTKPGLLHTRPHIHLNGNPCFTKGSNYLKKCYVHSACVIFFFTEKNHIHSFERDSMLYCIDLDNFLCHNYSTLIDFSLGQLFILCSLYLVLICCLFTHTPSLELLEHTLKSARNHYLNIRFGDRYFSGV